jgi:adenylate cyclase
LRRLRELRGASAAGGRQPLAGTIIFLTNTATGIADLGATPFGPNQPLVLLHATALNDLFQGSFIRRPPRWVDALSLLIVPLFATLFPLCPRKRILVIAWLLGTSVVLVAGAALLFRFHVAPATFTIMLLWSACTVAELARRHTCEWHARQRLRDTMSLYFSPRVLDAVIKDPGNLSPKKVGITVLLTDLRNSTPLAELLGADGMLELLNQVFELENRAVFEADGSLEKPVGDQFLAYWGAPEPQPDAADRAVRAALALIESMEAFRASCETQVRRLFGYGVALHAGRSLIGNIGSAQFFHYGPVGDVLNATARIESLTKYYGVLMIMTREVYSKLTAPPCARVLDEVIVKGKSSPLELIEIEHKFNAANFKELAARYGDAFQLYKAGNFTEAGQLFRALAATDKPSEAMVCRCTALQANPPEEWTGIFRMETK